MQKVPKSFPVLMRRMFHGQVAEVTTVDTQEGWLMLTILGYETIGPCAS